MADALLSAALAYAKEGLFVVPVSPGTKAPAVGRDWPAQVSRNPKIIRRWWAENPNAWIGIATGNDRLGVIDLDVKQVSGLLSYQKLCEKLEIAKPETRTAQTPSGGQHLYFRLPGDTMWGNHVGILPGVDLRGHRGQVVAPPSGDYTWLSDGPIAEIPPDLLAEILELVSTVQPRGGHSALSALIGDPPAGEGNRNDWFAKVLGHLVNGVRFEDGLVTVASVLNDHFHIFSDAEFEDEIPKMASSLLNKDSRKTDLEKAEWTAANGYLVGDDRRLWTKIKVDDVWRVVEFANFDLRVIGVAQDDEKRYWRVAVLPADGGEYIAVIEPGVLADGRRLTAWLAAHGGVSCLPPSNDRRGNEGRRLLRYMEAQDAPHQQVVPWMGDNDEHGWVVAEGVISSDGLDPKAPVIPAAAAQTRSVHRYGFGDRRAAVRILRETLTFQEEEVTSVFGAWWAACVLKGHLMREGAALFPFVAIEGPAETGKTQGFFADMLQLNGNIEGSSATTTASLRERVAAHRNGIVWIDDLTATDHIQEILRQATAEGVRTKMADDNTRVTAMKLVAPIVISGENLAGFTSEKALVDRAVHLLVRSPKGRRSIKNPKRLQWDDRMALKQKYGDYSMYAGTLVQGILQRAEMVSEFRELRGGGGRFGDKVGILRVGARVLADLVGDSSLIKYVEDWCTDQDVAGLDDNHLLREVLPTILLELRLPRSAMGYMPAFVDDKGYVWYNEPRLLSAWEKHTRGRDRLASIDSFRAQRKAFGLNGTGVNKQVDHSHSSRMLRYHRLPLEESARVVERSGFTMPRDMPREAFLGIVQPLLDIQSQQMRDEES